MYKRILVPLDGSTTADLGLREAIALAQSHTQKHKPALLLLHVINEFGLMMEMSGAVDYEKVHRSLERHAHDMLARARDHAEKAGLHVQTMVAEIKGGRVADAIVDAARDADCDLIVLGTHGRRGLGRALLGSDAESVLRQAAVPVLLVREQATKR